ncbi:MAG TPA: CHY zinc finger protein [Chitinophagaceae bacterium]|nr:CHY zinc finger protein [Chitinophagaceae bacterium]
MSEIKVYGKVIDDNTRCEHYHSPLDIIAIKFKCCDKYYPCYQCHEETTGHPAQIWSKDEWDTKAILCGGCKSELTINEYMQSGNCCPNCKAPFNPNCSKHYHLYFQT